MFFLDHILYSPIPRHFPDFILTLSGRMNGQQGQETLMVCMSCDWCCKRSVEVSLQLACTLLFTVWLTVDSAIASRYATPTQLQETAGTNPAYLFTLYNPYLAEHFQIPQTQSTKCPALFWCVSQNSTNMDRNSDITWNRTKGKCIGTFQATK